MGVCVITKYVFGVVTGERFGDVAGDGFGVVTGDGFGVVFGDGFDNGQTLHNLWAATTNTRCRLKYRTLKHKLQPHT